ncbi:MAG: hypothetical protein WC140_00510 [Bacteroidales bacterium]
MKTFVKFLTYVILPVVIIFLAYLIVDSIEQPVRFKKQSADRQEVAKQRLIDIRTLQEAYKTEYGRFLSTTDSLINFYKHDSITIVKQIGSMDDSLAVAQNRVKTYKLRFAVADTLLKNSLVPIDSIKFIPYSGGVPIELKSIVKSVSGVNVPLFEASMPYDNFLKGLDRQLIVNLKASKEDLGRYPGLKVGSITSPNNNAGNWE